MSKQRTTVAIYTNIKYRNRRTNRVAGKINILRLYNEIKKIHLFSHKNTRIQLNNCLD